MSFLSAPLLLVAWLAVLLVGAAGQSVNYATATCNALVSDFTGGNAEAFHTEANSDPGSLGITSPDSIFFMPFRTPVGNLPTMTTTIQTIIDDNAGTYGYQQSGPVAMRFGIFNMTQAADATTVPPTQPLFSLLMQTEQVVLYNPTFGVYNATLIDSTGAFAYFIAQPNQNLYLGEWFNTSIYQPYSDGIRSFMTVQNQYNYSAHGFPSGNIVAPLMNDTNGAFNTPSGGIGDEPLQLSACGTLGSPMAGVGASSSSSTGGAAVVYPTGSVQTTYRETGIPASTNVNSAAFYAAAALDIAANLARLSGLSVSSILPYITVTSVVVSATNGRRLLQTTQTVQITFVISNTVHTTTPTTTALSLATLFQTAANAGPPASPLAAPNTAGTIPAQLVVLINPNGGALPGDGAMYSDPYFSGFWQQTFYVHGQAGSVYNLVSDRHVSLNSRFVFLNNVTCPTLSAEELLLPAKVHCSSHPGTYFGEMGFVTASGDQLYIAGGTVTAGFSSVTVNGQAIEVGQSYGAPLEAAQHDSHTGEAVEAAAQPGSHPARSTLYVHRSSSRSMVVHAGLYELLIENSDQYVDVVTLHVANWPALLDVVQPNGLMGVTWDVDAPIPPSEELHRELDGELMGCNVPNDKFCAARQAQQVQQQ